MVECNICPRKCICDRAAGQRGFCSSGMAAEVSRVSLHMFEEPPISGTQGSGTIFFSGCNLRCVFCQNSVISRGEGQKKSLSHTELADVMLELEERGAHNINLVTPTHFTFEAVKAIELAKKRLKIPIIWNSSAYEAVDSLRALSGLVDVYLPDFKYASGELAQRYSRASDYPEVARFAVTEMFSQAGECVFDGDGMIKRGVIVRHLVLPSHRKDSMAVLDILADILSVDKIKLSLMSQYTPEFAKNCEFENLHRRITSFEYDSVLKYAISLGFDGYFQSRSSASTEYTPNFLCEEQAILRKQ